MRIRTIKPQFFKNDELAELPMSARLFFIGLWTLADSEGRLEDRPRRIKAEIFPFDNIDADDLLSRLQSAGFIIRYTSSGGQHTESGFSEMKVIQIVNFTKHQKLSGREAEYESDFPPPPDPSNVKVTAVLQESALEATETEQIIIGETFGKNVERFGKIGKDLEKSGKIRKNVEREKDQEKERERNNKERIYNESANSDELPSSGISTLIYSQDALDFAAWFKTLLPKAQKVSQSNLKDWAKTYDDCIRLDSRARDEILAVCEWARADTFWSANFQSASKLRQKNKTGVQYFDVFLQQMNKNNGTARNIHNNGTATRSFGTIADAQREHDDFLAAGRALIANGQVAR